MIIPTEARATMAAYRQGKTLEQFHYDMWERRSAEHPRETKSTAKWPKLQGAVMAAPPLTDQQAAKNVTQIRKQSGKAGG